jgi:predicted Zn-dependent peptidase
MSSLAHAEPAFTERTFPNGMKWIHRTVTHNRIAALQLFIPRGLPQETDADAGVTRLMAATMMKGTRTRTALAIAQQTESLGAGFGFDAEGDFFEASAQSITDQFPALAEIFQDVLLHPVFPAEEVDKERQAQLNSIHTSQEQIFNVADEALRSALYGAHPYGRPEEGTVASVTALTRDKLAAWHGRVVRPAGAVLVTVGNLPGVEKWVEGLAAAWSRSGDAGDVSPVVPFYPTAPVVKEERPDFEQAYVMLAWPAPAVGHPSYEAVKVLNGLLGAGMSSPLFQVVREEGTLAYEVSSFFRSRRMGSGFVVYAGMDPKNLDLAESKTRSVIGKFIAAPPSADALTDAKRYLRGHYVMDHQTNGRIAWYLGWWEILGRGAAHDAVYPDRLEAVTADDVHRAAAALFRQPSVTVRLRSVPTGK